MEVALGSTVGESNHGKGSSDSDNAAGKIALRHAIADEKYDIQTSKDALDFLDAHLRFTTRVNRDGTMKGRSKKNRHTVRRRHYRYYAAKDVNRKAAIKTDTTVRGTQAHHRYIGTRAHGEILYSWISCDCVGCRDFQFDECRRSGRVNFGNKHGKKEGALNKATMVVPDLGSVEARAIERKARVARRQTHQRLVKRKGDHFCALDANGALHPCVVDSVEYDAQGGKQIAYQRCAKLSTGNFALEGTLLFSSGEDVLPPVGFRTRMLRGRGGTALYARTLQRMQQTLADVASGVL